MERERERERDVFLLSINRRMDTSITDVIIRPSSKNDLVGESILINSSQRYCIILLYDARSLFEFLGNITIIANK